MGEMGRGTGSSHRHILLSFATMVLFESHDYMPNHRDYLCVMSDLPRGSEENDGNFRIHHLQKQTFNYAYRTVFGRILGPLTAVFRQ